MEQPVNDLTPAQFHAADGVDDWRVLVFSGACAHFRTGSFSTGVTFIGAIAELADAAGHYPDVDLRKDSVLVRTRGLSTSDLELAQQISQAAREFDLHADPSAVQSMNITIDALVSADVIPFWRAVLGYDQVGTEDLLDPTRHNPSFWFQDMSEPRIERNRIHVDLGVPHDQAEARVEKAIAAGGRLVSDERAPMWWTLADAEGNEVDVTTWVGRG
jgi:4a-hydroxytetrahydrobiopterin dehydratase